MRGSWGSGSRPHPARLLLVWGGVVVATVLAVGYLAARIISGKQSDFLLELPPMRTPAIRNILVKTLARMEWYLWEVVPIFVLGTALLFLLNITGALAWLQVAMAPLVVNWLGLPVEATNALLVGFLRRDYGAAGLFDMHRNGQLSPASCSRFTVARTVDGATPVRRAISRTATSPADSNRKISRT